MYIDNFILLLEKIFKLKIDKDDLEVHKWDSIYKDEQIPLPAYLKSDIPTNIVMAINDMLLIGQNPPSEIRKILEESGKDDAFPLILTTNMEGNFINPVTKSDSEKVFTFLDSLLLDSKKDESRRTKNRPPNGSASTILELPIPINEKLLYRLLYGIISEYFKTKQKESIDLDVPIQEEIMDTGEKKLVSGEIESKANAKMVIQEQKPKVENNVKVGLYQQYWSLLKYVDILPRSEEENSNRIEKLRDELVDWYYTKKAGIIFKDQPIVEEIFKNLIMALHHNDQPYISTSAHKLKEILEHDLDT